MQMPTGGWISEWGVVGSAQAGELGIVPLQDFVLDKLSIFKIFSKITRFQNFYFGRYCLISGGDIRKDPPFLNHLLCTLDPQQLNSMIPMSVTVRPALIQPVSIPMNAVTQAPAAGKVLSILI